MKWYVEAVESGDYQTVFKLTDAREKAEVGVSEAGIRRAFQTLNDLPLRAGQIDVGHMLKMKEGPLYQYFVNWLDSRTGKPLPGTRPLGRAEFRQVQSSSFLVVKTTPEGLRVATTLFLYSTCRNRHGYLLPFVKASREAGITGWIHRDGEVKRLEEISSLRLIAPQDRTRHQPLAAPDPAR
jgi:hypothetical protein